MCNARKGPLCHMQNKKRGPRSAHPVCKFGPCCSKLTMSLVNVSLKLCKSYSHFFSKNSCEFDIVLIRTVNILTTNELIKLTMFWTTGPWTGPSLLLICSTVFRDSLSKLRRSWSNCMNVRIDLGFLSLHIWYRPCFHLLAYIQI